MIELNQAVARGSLNHEETKTTKSWKSLLASSCPSLLRGECLRVLRVLMVIVNQFSNKALLDVDRHRVRCLVAKA